MSRTQLLGLGLSARAIDRSVDGRVLVPLHAGVYLHSAIRLTRHGRLAAACVACGPGAVASHRSAGWLWQLKGVRGWRPEVTVFGGHGSTRSGITVHRSVGLDPVDVTRHEDVPVTGLPATLLHLGAVLPFEAVEQAAQDAIIRGVVSAIDLVSVLERLGGRGRRGTAPLRAVVAHCLPDARIESELERRLHAVLTRLPVPSPEVQYEVELRCGSRMRLDFAWPDRRLAIEADGRRWHSTGTAFEADMARRRALVADGWRHVSYGWNDVTTRRTSVGEEVTRLVLGPHAAPRDVLR